jgi:hypothetical protein
MASTKLVTGWMACAVLGIAELNLRAGKETRLTWQQGRVFSIFAAGMILAATFALSLRGVGWISLSQPVLWGGLLLIGLGLLHLAFTSDSFRVICGLLTLLSGFEVLYAAIESSILVTALLAVVNLGLALTGAYILNVAQEKFR